MIAIGSRQYDVIVSRIRDERMTIVILCTRYGIFMYGSALHGDRCIAGCEADTNFADESICMLADNVRNEVVTIHRSQEVLKKCCPSTCRHSSHWRKTFGFTL
jgi:hypothetical protein